MLADAIIERGPTYDTGATDSDGDRGAFRAGAWTVVACRTGTRGARSIGPHDCRRKRRCTVLASLAGALPAGDRPPYRVRPPPVRPGQPPVGAPASPPWPTPSPPP